MPEPSLLIVGCGDLGRRTGLSLLAEGWKIDAVRRNTPHEDSALQWHSADYTTGGSLAFIESLAPTFVLATFTPASMNDEGYRRGFRNAAHNLLEGLGSHRCRHLFMVSSTRVYAEADGGWVDEASPLATADPRAQAIIDAEQLLLTSRHPTTIVRAGGIYGNPISRLLDRIKGGRLTPAHPVRYTNRIHREDLSGFIAHLLKCANRGQSLESVYNAVDNSPAPAHEVDRWLAGLMGVNAGAESAIGRISPSGHKRCRNDRLRASGYPLLYSDFRAGYAALLHGDR